MIRRCTKEDFKSIYTVINDAAFMYKGVIPNDMWKQPYMSEQELRDEIVHGVNFWGYEQDRRLVGVMGIQDVMDVSLIRHAYVIREIQRKGIGTKLLKELLTLTEKPVLIGTWRAAKWAIRFYEKHGFRLVSDSEKDLLLKKYWNIPQRQVETSVVLADQRWFNRV